MLFDYHTHTPRCKHAVGELDAYLQQAAARGLAQVGVSDHLPWSVRGAYPVTMDPPELPAYLADVHTAQQGWQGRLKVLLGGEADWDPSDPAESARVARLANFDYLIGSVHFLAGWPLDRDAEDWRDQDIEKIWRDYFAALRGAAESGLYQIMGHCDLVKKFKMRPTADMTHEYRATAQAFAKAGVLVELNSSGLRKPCAEIYPSQAFLAELRAAGVGLTLGSDAHDPADVGRDFDKALAWAGQAGYDTLWRWAAPKAFEPVKIASL